MTPRRQCTDGGVPRRRSRAQADSPAKARATARQAALKMVGRRALSEAELSARLLRKGYAGEEIVDAVGLVLSYGYVNDQELALSVRREAARTGHGPAWVASTLLRRGLTEEQAQSAAEASAADERELLLEVAARRFGDVRELSGSERQRAFRFLVGRGFSHERVASLLDVGS